MCTEEGKKQRGSYLKLNIGIKGIKGRNQILDKENG